MIIYAIDPGPDRSGVVAYDTEARTVKFSQGDMPNEIVLSQVRMAASEASGVDAIACECIEAMYAHVGKETVRTIRLIGRIEEAGEQAGKPVCMLGPQEIKKRICGTASAKDPAVRQALIDKLGPPGTKKAQGPTYGVTKHAWRALAVAVASTTNL